MAKTEKQKLAREMRSEGESIKHIAKVLMVSPSSVSSWCVNVKLSDQQIKRLEANAHDPNYGKRLDNALKQRSLRIEKTKKLRIIGIEEVGELSARELMLVGTALYWAEGYKKDNQAGFGSSDPKMLLLYVRWLMDCFHYSTNDLLFRVTVNASHQYRINEIVSYWANVFNINTDRFQKPFYQHAKWKKTYEHPENYFGVLRIRPRRSSDVLRRILGMIEGLKNNT